MNKFIIFASARTGSTSLADLLGKSKDVKLCFEPFNEHYSKWRKDHKDYYHYIKNIKTLNIALSEISRKFNAMKVLDYQLPKNLYSVLLKNPEYKILFLRRKNLFEMAISDLVAHQVSKWQKEENTSVYDNLQKINPEEFKEKIKYIKELNNYYSGVLEKNRSVNDYMNLYYEDLYSESLKRNTGKIRSICKFLDISAPDEEFIKKYMTPSIAKINYSGIYKTIPNYYDLIIEYNKLTSDQLI